MQRPVMDPMFLRDHPEPSRHQRLGAALAAAGRALRWVGRQLIRQPFRLRRRAAAALDDESTAGKIVRGLVYRMVFVPVGVSLASAGIVFFGTHPARVDVAPPQQDPASQGVFYDPINFASDDGTRLEAWLVPVVDARRVLLNKDHLFRMQYPAVVLAHDFGRGPEQMMPLLAPLHEDGFVVVAVGLRGVGAGRAKGQTFGVYEAQDVQAAVNMLRRRPFVDPDRIGVLGIGTGANAALLVTQRDGRIGAVGLADPVPTPDDAVARYVGPDRFGLRWMQVLNKWTFQMAYHVDLDEMRLSRVDILSPARPVLRIDGRTTVDGRLPLAAVEEVRGFYRKHLKERTPPAPAPAAAPAAEAVAGRM